MSARSVKHCCAAWSLLASACGFAQSIDPSGASLALHQAFLLRLPVRSGDIATLSAQQLRACVEADFQSGSTLLSSDQMNVTLQAAASPAGWQSLVFEHPHIVEEPLMLARVVLRCPARFEREFIVRAVVAPAHSPRVAAVATAARVAAPPRMDGVAPRAPAQRHAKPEVVEDHPVRAHDIAGAAPSAPPSPSFAPDNSAHLRAEIGRLHAALAEAQSKAGAVLPATPLAPERASTPGDDDIRFPRNTALLLLAGTLAGLLPLLHRWRLRLRLPKVKTMDIARPSAAPPVPAPTRPSPIHVVVEGRPETPDLIPPTAIAPGAASLEDRDAARFTRQIDGLVADGYLEVAVSLLEKSLEATPARNPWLMLQLLALYERSGELGKGAALIGQLQTLYRVHLPTLGGVVQPGRALLDAPALLVEIEHAWASPDLLETLEDLIFRGAGPTWDLATFQDLLMLHAVAATWPSLAAPPVAPSTAPFNPVLEWTVHDDP